MKFFCQISFLLISILTLSGCGDSKTPDQNQSIKIIEMSSHGPKGQILQANLPSGIVLTNIVLKQAKFSKKMSLYVKLEDDLNFEKLNHEEFSLLIAELIAYNKKNKNQKIDSITFDLRVVSSFWDSFVDASENILPTKAGIATPDWDEFIDDIEPAFLSNVDMGSICEVINSYERSCDLYKFGLQYYFVPAHNNQHWKELGANVESNISPYASYTLGLK